MERHLASNAIPLNIIIIIIIIIIFIFNVIIFIILSILIIVDVIIIIIIRIRITIIVNDNLFIRINIIKVLKNITINHSHECILSQGKSKGSDEINLSSAIFQSALRFEISML